MWTQVCGIESGKDAQRHSLEASSGVGAEKGRLRVLAESGVALIADFAEVFGNGTGAFDFKFDCVSDSDVSLARVNERIDPSLHLVAKAMYECGKTVNMKRVRGAWAVGPRPPNPPPNPRPNPPKPRSTTGAGEMFSSVSKS